MNRIIGNKVVPYLERLKDDLGSRQNPYLLYITKGGTKKIRQLFPFPPVTTNRLSFSQSSLGAIFDNPLYSIKSRNSIK